MLSCARRTRSKSATASEVLCCDTIRCALMRSKSRALCAALPRRNIGPHHTESARYLFRGVAAITVRHVGSAPLEYESVPSPAEPPKGALAVIFFIVVMDLLGFGIIIPLLAFYVPDFQSNPLKVTALFSTYSICQFIGAPILGLVSDRFGASRCWHFRKREARWDICCWAWPPLTGMVPARGSCWSIFRASSMASPAGTSPRRRPTSATSPRRRIAPREWECWAQRSGSAFHSGRRWAACAGISA